MHLAEICKWVRTEAGIRCSPAPHLVDVLEKFPRSWSGSRRRDSGPEAEGRHSIGDCGRNRVFCAEHLQVCNAYITGSPSPAVQATSRAQFMHTSHRTLHVRANGGWVHVACARCRGRGAPGPSNARRPTRFVRPVPARRARPGPRSPSLAAISPSSEGLSGAHHADKTNFSGGGSPQDFLAQCMQLEGP